MHTAIETHGLSRRFGRETVFGDVDLHVPAGGITALLGRRGAGKTTLLHILVGLLGPSRGRVRVLGLDPSRKGPLVRRRVGFVPERLALPDWMRIRDHLRFLEPFHPTWNRAEEARLLDLFDLDPRARIRRLSAANRARYGLLAALAHEPELLILDNPLSDVEPTSRDDILDAVRELLREDARTAVMAGHTLAHVERAADRVVLLDEGRLALEGDLKDIRPRTAHLRVTVAVGSEQWEPPGRPLIDYDGKDILLTYLERQGFLEEWIRSDPTVLMVRDLSSPAETEGRKEGAPCASSS